MKPATLPRAGEVIPGRETAVISAAGLRKRYGNAEAVRGIDLTVFEGEIFAFLGPKGGREDHNHRDAGGIPATHCR